MPSDEGLQEPLSRPLLGLLRRAVLDHAASERRRLYPPQVHVGIPDGLRTVFGVRAEEKLDHTLRIDIVEAMVRRTRRPGPVPMVWLTRRGGLEPQDVDLQWLRAARAAYAELEIPLLMVVANRRSWRDPRSGLGREWQRLRPS